MLALFGATIFLGAGLLFLVQPMVAKMLLPLYGGSPQVWTTSMLFFQAILLGGYAAAHLAASRLGPRQHARLQVVLLVLPLLALPITLPAFAAPREGFAPAAWLLLVLGVAAGLPFFVVTTTSPTLLRWFAATDHRHAGDPYFLYAAGNAGSLIALLAYPFVVEPSLASSDQARLWATGYVVLALLVGACALLTLRRSGHRGRALASRPTGDPEQATGPAGRSEEAAGTGGHSTTTPGPSRARPSADAPLTTRRRLWWVFLAFVPSSLMLGVTSYLTTDIAAVPLLWVIPLAIYLLTFIIAFSTRLRVPLRLVGALLAVSVAALALPALGIVALPIVGLMGLHLAALFAAGLLAHGRLAVDRPHPARLTEYFLLVSVGGVLGGLFNALVAPLLFEVVLEYVIAIVLALLVRQGLEPGDAPLGTRPARSVPAVAGLRRFAWSLDLVIPLGVFLGTLAGLVVASRWGDGALVRVVLGTALGVAILVSVRRPIRLALGIGALLAMALLVGRPALHSDRTFFGLSRVTADEDGRHRLAHGTTIHGAQWTDPPRSAEPLTYYHRSGPVGQVFDTLARADGWRHAAVIGLGAGSMAAYGRHGHRMTFYEIDPAMVEIASDPSLFTFLRDADAAVEIVLGDGRLMLAEAPDGAFDVIFMDAFSSDAPPVHLLTREAMRLYLRKLARDGMLVFNVSNRYLDLATVVERQARDAGLAGLEQFDTRLDEAPPGDKAPSRFVVLARTAAILAPLAANGRWQEIGRPEGRPWTDDYSDVIGALRHG